ncbi:MAG: HDOD domain-containing protein [Dehalococcoidia bacterium]
MGGLSVVHIPPLPTAQAQSMALVMSKDASIAELAAVIETDPAMTLGILRLANAAAAQPVARVAKVSQAMIRIGLEDTRRVVLSVALNSGTAANQFAQSGIDGDELWRHVVGVGLLAHGIVSVDPSLQEYRHHAFSAGLLHDIGRLAMAATAPDRYRRVVDSIICGADPLEAERREFADDHAVVGGVVGRSWQLPTAIVDAIEGHPAGDAPLAVAVRRASVLAGRLGIGDGIRAAEPASLQSTDDDALAVMHLGGPERLLNRIEWFRGALA